MKFYLFLNYIECNKFAAKLIRKNRIAFLMHFVSDAIIPKTCILKILI